MSIDPLRDPEGVAAEHLLKACPFSGKRVVEVGCGDGRLVWRYAGLPRSVVGIDPEGSDLREAAAARPAFLQKVSFVQARAEALPFSPQSYEIVLLGWSL